MRFWRIVAGHRETPEDEEVKSMLLGDWLRNNYVAIGHRRTHPLYREFIAIKKNDKVVVTTDGYIWALGTVTNDELIPMRRTAHLYPHKKEVIWNKVMKLSYASFPSPLRNKLGYQKAINELRPDDWTTLLLYIHLNL